jgi:Mrp family chromosome partitioning ATPase
MSKVSEQDRKKAIDERMSRIRHKILVLSGKGGVGKSTVAVNIAASLALNGKRVGLMDIDIHGPSVSSLVHVKQVVGPSPDGGIQPLEAMEGLKVMSIGYMMQNREAAIIWRGPMKHGMIGQFLGEVEWGDLDILVVDSPPGTGDEPLSVAQMIENLDGAVIVTTPQAVAIDDVRRSISFCRKLNLHVIGVVENMSGFVCPHCGKESDIFKRGGGAVMAEQMKVPFLGEIPIDPAIVSASDDGVPFIQQFPESRTARSFRGVIQPIVELEERNEH